MTLSVMIGVLTESGDNLVSVRRRTALPAEFHLQRLPFSDRPPADSKLSDSDIDAVSAVSGIVVERPVTESGFLALCPDAVQKELQQLPVCSDEKLADPVIRGEFIRAASARAEFDALAEVPLTTNALIQFHSRYKLLLLAHSQPLYRQLGPLVAGIAQWPSLQEFADEYRRRLMEILLIPASRKNHTNVLMHIQGYFRPALQGGERQQLAATIDQYRCGQLPLSVPLNELRGLLVRFPHPWLASQRYLFPYLPAGGDVSSAQETL